MKELFLTSWTAISPEGYFAEGELKYRFKDGQTHLENLRELYSFLALSYLKFFKMDTLCKLGILGTERLFDEKFRTPYSNQEIAIILSNKHSSLDSDVQHQQNINEGTVSPAVFVYTLPNIVIGEISIRHKLHGESNFYITPEFDANLLMAQAQILCSASATQAIILGWVDIFEKKMEAVFFRLEMQGEVTANAELLNTLKNSVI